MARFASFSTPDAGMPGGGQTLAALMARQKQLADQQSAQASSAYPGQGTIPGGLGHMAQMFFTGLAQRKAQQQEIEGRQALAKAIAGIDPSTGLASPDQLATVMGLDPDLGAKLYAEAAAARRSDREYQRSRADTLSDRAAQYAHEGEVDARELAQAQAARKEEEAFTVSQTQAGTQAEIEKEKRQAAMPQTDVAKLKADLDAGRIDQQTYDAALAKSQPETYGPIISGDQAKALGLDATKQYQKNLKTGQYDPIGGAGVTIQNVPAELSAKIALGDEFLSNYDSIRASAAAGEMTGIYDYQRAVGLGRGPGGAAYRGLKSGSEALIRMLTGAGKSQGEAEDEVKQYLPSWTDDADTLVSKIDGLKARLTRIRESVGEGRNMLPLDTGKGGSDLPEGVTEDDITETMRANNMTREQVLAKLKGQTNAGP